MSEYELSLLRQRGLAARDSKAQRGELRFALPPGYCWNELGQMVMDPDERLCEAIRLMFRKFRELASARQVLLWLAQEQLQLPVMRQSRFGSRIEWKRPAYHNVLETLQHPVYAQCCSLNTVPLKFGALFGRRGARLSVPRRA